jgi:hypothetical protein
MAKLPSWKDLKNAAKIDPERAEELRRNAQRGAERGRQGVAKRLAGPAAHLKTVGSQFRAGLTEPEPATAAEPTVTEPAVTDPTAGPTAEPKDGTEDQPPAAR